MVRPIPKTIVTKPAKVTTPIIAKPAAKSPRPTTGALASKPPTAADRAKRDAQRRASAERGRQSRGVTTSAPVAPLTPQQGGINYTNPTDIAQAQQFYNNQNVQQQVGLNRFNEANPYGSKEFVTNPDGSVTKKVNLSAEQQGILDAFQKNEQGTQGFYGQTLGQAQARVGQGLNFDGLQQLDTQNDATRQRYEQSLVDRQLKILGPQLEQQKQAQIDDLRARGIQYGSPEYDKRMQVLNDQQARQLSDIGSAATLQGGQEASQMLQNQLGVNTQQAGQRTQEYQAPLQSLQAVNSLRQGVSNPAFENTAQIGVNTVDATGLGGQFAGQQFQGQQADLGRQFDATQQASQNKFTASQSALDRAAQLQAARMGGGRGGGAAPRDPIADYQARAQIDYDFQQKNKPPKPSSPYGPLIGNVLGQGLGAVINSFTK